MTGPATEISEKLYRGSIYDGFRPTLGPDLQGWNSRHAALRDTVTEIRATVIFDVGVWKGLSCIFLADVQRKLGIEGAVVAVDTFLGSPEHWNHDRPDRIHDSLRFVNGWPGLYWQFLSNMVWEGCEDRVVPMAQTSENAAVILHKQRVLADLIHIDAAHEYEPVLRDCRRFWALLKPGGILIGDDYSWKGVARAADEFAVEVGLELEVRSPKWIIRKPTHWKAPVKA